MGGNLAADFAARETSGVHIRIGGPSAECAQEAGEVMQIESLIGRAGGVQRNDVGCGRCAGDRTGGGLRAIMLLRDVRVALGSAAEKCHHRIIGAFKTKVNVGDQGRAAQARPSERPTECGAVFAQLCPKVPWAPLAFGGTSLKVDSCVEKRRAPSSLLLACVEKLPDNKTAKAASAILMHSFFISCSFLSTKKTAERENQGCWRPVR